MGVPNESNHYIDEDSQRRSASTNLSEALTEFQMFSLATEFNNCMSKWKWSDPPDRKVRTTEEGSRTVIGLCDYELKREFKRLTKTDFSRKIDVEPRVLRQRLSDLLNLRREKLIKLAIILHEVYGAMDVALHALSLVGRHSNLANTYYYQLVDSLPTEKYIPGRGIAEVTQGFRPPRAVPRRK